MPFFVVSTPVVPSTPVIMSSTPAISSVPVTSFVSPKTSSKRYKHHH